MLIPDILANKPVLVGLHLVFAILGIDFFLWLAGEIIANPAKRSRMFFVAGAGLASFILSWFLGGYYYVNYYGTIVKPVIKAGSAPWAHSIAMEAKEHIFLLIIPLAATAFLMAFLKKKTVQENGLKIPFLILTLLIAFIALSIGLMGYIISAAARWG
ncbi:MAG: hypothetical protein A3C27_03740 [Candidatus Levybacteria bacterium RIFCSPHIGHO2_02_FULL_39_36]|nr:MAG: hypothetical protein UT57_C0011G0006 [Microgenomates group bacterium GW2011_GWC1_39_7]OGH27486.1 MAG: hypothetical protein A3C27_03740 [Candidatus Levybacteria bacterium RIFCSPHIGHO2_02_FULL_39_36]OGH45609.1 MAG: hypothetical protein A3H82_00010 [Candidatus Levybacteria bacterium RIFCSPLOWO2_02_FULL_39_26]OGH47783.1 MAG: hypothetical protein A3G66_01865 [Candidatus Levybacteria bacterium RIFCSPLOWO2_12_FULL_39_17]